MINKKNILRASLASFAIATVLGIYVTLATVGTDESVAKFARTTAVASILGIFGISSFFVGLAYPKE